MNEIQDLGQGTWTYQVCINQPIQLLEEAPFEIKSIRPNNGKHGTQSTHSYPWQTKTQRVDF